MPVMHVQIPTYDDKAISLKEVGDMLHLQVIGPLEDRGEKKQLLVVRLDPTMATLLAQSLTTVIKTMNKR